MSRRPRAPDPGRPEALDWLDADLEGVEAIYDADGVVVDAAGGAADEQRAVLAMCASVRNASSEAWRDVRLTLCANELELLPCGPSDGPLRRAT